jgi:hypothetical protein
LQAELLRNDFMPTDDEIAAITERVDAGQKLAPLDVFLHKLAQVPRGKEKLSMIMQMETVADAAEQIVPKAMSVQLASNSLLSSTKLQKVLEVVLAFGNHMNSGRRGGAWGFKLSVFDQLLNTKTADRRMNLMHFVESTVRATSPESVGFASELVDIPVAGTISLTGLQQELDQARNVLNKVEKECADPEAANPNLLAFYQRCAPKLDEAEREVAEAKVSFKKVLSFFAEETLTEPTAFFAVFVRLSEQFDKAEKENAQRARQKEKKAAAEAAHEKERSGGGGAGSGSGSGGQRSVAEVFQTDISATSGSGGGDDDEGEGGDSVAPLGQVKEVMDGACCTSRSGYSRGWWGAGIKVPCPRPLVVSSCPTWSCVSFVGAWRLPACTLRVSMAFNVLVYGLLYACFFELGPSGPSFGTRATPQANFRCHMFDTARCSLLHPF